MNNFLAWVEQIGGAMLILFVFLDIFLTVLYARADTGILSYRLSQFLWRFFCWMSRRVGPRRSAVLSFCGPVIILLLVVTWAFLLTFGTALIIHPNLGTSIRAANGETATDFLTALYVGGSSMSIIRISDYAPQSPTFRLFFLFTSLLGTLVVSLTLAYLVEVYNALQQRNTLGLKLHLLTAETDDAAELVAGLGPDGQFSTGYSILVDLAAEVTAVKEAYHFYPLLFYFRFRPPFYSVSQFTLLSLDTVTLLKSALDDQHYAWLKESASVGQLWRASLMLVTLLEKTFLPQAATDQPKPPDPPTRERWEGRYYAGLRRLQRAGIHTIIDERLGAAVYVSLRSQWDSHITALAPSMAYEMSEIDPVGSDPEAADRRHEFRSRLHSSG
jgi:hypothetical protein